MYAAFVSASLLEFSHMIKIKFFSELRLKYNKVTIDLK